MQVTNFFKNRPLRYDQRDVSKSIDLIAGRVYWKQKYAASTSKWLKNAAMHATAP